MASLSPPREKLQEAPTRTQEISHEESRFRPPFDLRSRLGLLAIVVVYLIFSAVLLSSLLHRTGGHLIYPLDDSYIHMSIAKNLGLHGVWGVTRNEFTSSSSSPLWILLLAALYRIFGVHEWMPVVLNVAVGVLVLSVVYRRVSRSGGPAFTTTLLLCFLVPIPMLALSGMEHLVHVLLVILFATAAVRVLETRSGDAGLVLLIPLMVL